MRPSPPPPATPGPGLGWPAVIVTDAAGLITHWSATAELLYGWSATEALGQPILDLSVDRHDQATAAEIMAQLGAGEPWQGRFVVRRKDGAPMPVMVVDAPLFDAAGTVVGVVGLSVPINEPAVDAAERGTGKGAMGEGATADLGPERGMGDGGTGDGWREAAERLVRLAERRADLAARRLRALQRIAAALAGPADPLRVADLILTEVAPHTGGTTRAFWLVDHEAGELRLVRGDEDRPRTRTYAVIPLTSGLPGAEVTRTRRPVYLETLQQRDADFPSLADVDGFNSCAVLPLVTSAGVTAVIALGFPGDHVFDADERLFLEAVADQAAQALDRTRLHARHVEVVQLLQQSLLPPRLVDVPYADLAAAYYPAEDGTDVGGDFYDLFPLPGGRWALMIGDVRGTGPAAAALTALVRHTARAVARSGAPAPAVVAAVNDALADSADDETFCTFIYVEAAPTVDGIDLRTVGAGHPPPFIVHPDGTSEILHAPGPLLGVIPGARYVETRARLEPGDALMLYTDGVIECRAQAPSDEALRAFFDEHRLGEALAGAAGSGAAGLVGAVEMALLEFAGGRLADDVAIFAIRATP